jgi:hypothetical protein
MTISDEIALVGVIVTAITAVATLWTILEVKRQRTQTYRPDLFIAEIYSTIYAFDPADKHSSFEYIVHKNLEENKSRYEKDPKDKSMFFDLRIFNVGFGTAKFVKYNSTYDFARLARLVKKENERRKHFKIEVTHEDVVIEDTISNHYDLAQNDDALSKGAIDFVLPYNATTLKYSINVPLAYLDLLTYYVILKYDMMHVDTDKTLYIDELEEVPTLTIKLEFKDLANTTHVKRFNVRFVVVGRLQTREQRPHFNNPELGGYHVKVNAID